MTTYTILYNPHAGNGCGEQNARKLEHILTDCTLTYRDITEITDYSAFFQDLSPECTLILSGGDGTLNRFVNDTAGISLPTPLYYYAGGSGNDFLRDVAPSNPLIDLNPYLSNLPTVTVNGKTFRFLNGVGFGIDGYCCEEGDRLRETTRRPVNYTAIAIKGLLFHYHPTNAVITVDSVRHSYRKVWLAPTMNGRYYGGGMMPTPDQTRCNPQGTISTMVFHGSGKLKTLMIFPSIFSGTHLRYTRQVEILTGQHIHVEFDRPTPLQIDGETISNVTSYEISACVPVAVS